MPVPTVAILQNQFRLSGRTKAVCETIHILNEWDIVPDVLTFTPESTGRQMGCFFGLENLRFNHVRIAPIPFKRGGLWQVLAINQLTRPRHARYSLVFNSNNTLQGFDPTANYLHYIYYPYPANGANFSRFRESSWRFLYSKVCAWMLEHSGDLVADDKIYSISEFAKDALLRSYPELESKIKLLYPPSFNGEIIRNRDRALRCVSVGSFSPDKKQLQQLAIASELPDVEFWIVGSVRSKSYYQSCIDFVKSYDLNNVYLKPDMPFEELREALATAMFFLHTMQNEPFGMGTVEAIAAGCISIVHNSGGQREAVLHESLRFSDVKHAVKIFRSLLGMSMSEIFELRDSLQKHIQRFSRDIFRRRMREALLEKMDI